MTRKVSKRRFSICKVEAPATDQSRKLKTKYRGPYQIARELRYDRYVVIDIREND